jgi:hypothetical protein
MLLKNKISVGPSKQINNLTLSVSFIIEGKTPNVDAIVSKLPLFPFSIIIFPLSLYIKRRFSTGIKLAKEGL